MAELPTSLGRIGIDSHEKALLVAPASYQDCTEPISVFPVPGTGERFLMRVHLRDVRFMTRSGSSVDAADRNVARLVALVSDDMGDEAKVVSFSQITQWRKAKPGTEIYLYAQLDLWKGYRSIKEPVLVPEDRVGQVMAVYQGRSGLTSGDAIQKGVAASRHALAGAASFLLQKVGFSRDQFERITRMSPEKMLADIHWPTGIESAINALAAARTLSLKAVSAQVLRSRQKPHRPASAIPISLDDVRKRVGQLPFTLTKDQRRAIWEIVQDLQSEYVMKRILSGDVGTGKTAVFLVPAVCAYDAGKTVAIIAPGRLLVRQLADELRSYFPDIPVAEVVGGDQLPDNGIVIGTTAVTLAAEASGRTFDFVVTDEQHKFSVAQRKTLLGENSNLLESTATAIPRTVALVAMGGMDVSALKECPVNKTIKSRIISKKKQAGLFAFIQEQIKAGGQVAVIYPLVESKKTEATVEAALERFAKFFGGRVGIIHGRQKADVKDETIRKMKEGEIDLLISSTVIEVGITLPSLKVMVVVNPEHFGASQLHQLRGRLARHGGEGWFFMFLKDNDSPRKETMQRLKLLVECSDGFELAERDAALRGAGEVFDELGSQSGSTSSVFFGIDLTYGDLERAVHEALMQGNRQPAEALSA